MRAWLRFVTGWSLVAFAAIWLAALILWGNW